MINLSVSPGFLSLRLVIRQLLPLPEHCARLYLWRVGNHRIHMLDENRRILISTHFPILAKAGKGKNLF